jgi:hypothetical protein
LCVVIFAWTAPAAGATIAVAASTPLDVPSRGGDDWGRRDLRLQCVLLVPPPLCIVLVRIVRFWLD